MTWTKPTDSLPCNKYQVY